MPQAHIARAHNSRLANALLRPYEIIGAGFESLEKVVRRGSRRGRLKTSNLFLVDIEYYRMRLPYILYEISHPKFYSNVIAARNILE